jgi:hypothetical protein
MSNLATIVNNILADSGIDDINVVVTTGSYTNPAWITSLAWTKITGAPANIVTGTGTNNYIAKFTSTGSTVGNSLLQSTASNVFIFQEDSSFGIDAQAATRIGFTKKGGAQPFVSYAADSFTIRSTAGTSIDASNTFVTQFSMTVAGVATFTNNLITSGVFRVDGTTDPNATNAAYFWNASGLGPTISGLKFQVRVGSTQTTRLFLSDLGYLGVNNISPQSNFVVSNDSGTQSIEINQLTARARIFSIDRTTSNWIPLYINDSGGNVIIGSTSNNGSLFQANGEASFGAATEKISMTSNGLAWNRRVSNGIIYDSNAFAYQFQHTQSTVATSDFLALQVYNTVGGSVTNNALAVNGVGNVSMSSLAGTGSRIVVADASGNLSASSALSGYVPYTGANQNVNLGSNTLQVNQRVGTIDDFGFHLRGVADVTHKLYYRSSDQYNAWEYNTGIRFYFYNAGNPFFTHTFASDGRIIATGSVTGSGAKSQIIADGGASAGAEILLKTSLTSNPTLRRNWAIATEDQVEGDFAIRSSTTAGGTPTATRLSILRDGMVGINMTTPIYQFDITTANYKSFRIQSSDDALMTIGSTIASSQFYSIGVSSSVSGQGANLFWIGTSTNNPSGTLTKNFTLSATGAATFSNNVSVNGLATSANYKLGVTGAAFISGANNKGVFITDSASYGSIVGLNSAISVYNSIELRASGVDGQLYLSTNGNVGINNTNPQTRLDVTLVSNATTKVRNTTFGPNGLVFLSGLGSDTNSEIGLFGGNAYGSLSAGIGIVRENSGNWGTQLRFYTHITSTSGDPADITEKMRITGDGRIGMGAVNPTTTLEVRGTGNTALNSSGNLMVSSGGGASQAAGSGGQLSFGAWLNGDLSNPYPLAAIRGVSESSSTNANTGALIFGTMDSNTAVQERMRINGVGNVGIGNWSTNVPQDRLHVNGAIQVGFVDVLNNALRIFWNGASSYGAIQTSSSSNLALNPSGNNVGINTTTPTDKLDVVGEVVFGAQTERLSMGSASLAWNRKVATGAIYNSNQFAYQFQRTGSTTAANDYLALQVYNNSGGGVNSTAFVVNGLANTLLGTGVDNSHRLRVEGSVYASGYMYTASEGTGFAVDANPNAGLARVGLMKYGGLEGMLTSGNSTSIRLGHRTDSDYVLAGGTPTFRVDLVITAAGAATFVSSVTATSFFESSDSRIKTELEDVLDYAAIANVTAKYYEKNGKVELGYFAQDFETLLPSAISENEEGYLNLSYREVHTAKIAYLEKEIKELKEKLKNK